MVRDKNEQGGWLGSKGRVQCGGGDRQTDIQTDIQTDRQTDRQTDLQTDQKYFIEELRS